MKIFLLILMQGILLFSCLQPDNMSSRIRAQGVSGTAAPGDLLTQRDAERILGEPAYLQDSSTNREEYVVRYQCAFKAKAEDEQSKKTGALYFLIEHYDHDSLAHGRYAFIKIANENHGIKTLQAVGDEAYFHSDYQNFYFIMARKGNKVFNMKVNKITSHTSLKEFKAVARKIVRSIGS